MTVLVDSFAWLEYFFGSEKGDVAAKYIEGSEEVVISPVNLIEVCAKYLKTAPKEAEEKRQFLIARCKIIALDAKIAHDAAKLKTEHGLGLADAVILATAREVHAKVLTGDKHFERFDDCIVI